MKSKLMILLISLIVLVTGCSKEEKVNKHQNLINVVTSKEKSISYEMGTDYFKNYKLYDIDGVKVSKYAYIDFDKDKVDELIIEAESRDGIYFVLHEQDNKVYTYILNKRQINKIKNNGEILSINGEQNEEINKLVFDRENLNIVNKAVINTINDIYILDDKESTKEEVEKYFQKYNQKEDLKWIESGDVK